jgi:flavoprotein, HI0933 family
MKTEVLVVGGGAAGMMAALTAAQQGAQVTLLERNEKVGRKIYITGKGRCNLTNDCQVREFLTCVPRGGKFLNSALFRFTPQDTMEFFEGLGVPLKVERGRRVFPVSDKASDVIDALFFALRRNKVKIVQARAEKLLLADGEITGVKTDSGDFFCKALVLATGGLSYPATGSTGDGYAMAQAAGHDVMPCSGSLLPLESADDCCKEMQGLSLKNVVLTLKSGGRQVFSEQGELLFTHFGISGPLVLSASALIDSYGDCTAHINLKPALSAQQLDERFLREFSEQKNRDLANILTVLLPRLMIEPFLKKSELSPDLKGHSITREQRKVLLETMQDFSFSISGSRPIEEAVVTRGGVRLEEVDPKTLESKLCKGLYLAGEILNIDGFTGGFNLQIAWSTGRAAGLGALKEIEELV